MIYYIAFMIQKVVLRDQVRDFLITQVHLCQLKPGEKINLAKLAVDLGVSVTPVREALTQLEFTGMVQLEPNRGFFLTPLSMAEAKDIYVLIAELEGLAMKSVDAKAHDLSKLRRLSKKVHAARDQMQALLLDREFHAALVNPCRNRILKRLLAEIKNRVLLYELEYMSSQIMKNKSLHSHFSIVEAMERGDITQAVDDLKEHWLLSLQFIVEGNPDDEKTRSAQYG